MSDDATQQLYEASFWCSVTSSVLCFVAAGHLRYVRLRAQRGDGMAAESAILPCLEPVVYVALASFVVQAIALDPNTYPSPPAWFNNAVYVGVAVDWMACVRYFLYWTVFEMVSLGTSFLFIAEWLSTTAIVRCLAGGVLAGCALGALTTFGFNYQNFEQNQSVQRMCDYTFLALPILYYLLLVSSLIPRRRTVLPFAVYSIMWRLIYIFVIAGAQAIEWPGVIMRIFVVVSQPIMLYLTLVSDSRYWRDMPRRVRRMSTASRLTGGTGSASHGSLSDLLLGNRRSLGRRRSGRRSSGKSWGTGGSSAGESSDLLADVGRAITPRPLPPALEELRAREGVAVIDFAFLAVSSTVVGRGASCTVYRGKLKGSAVAVKSFTPTSVTPLDALTICTETSMCSCLSHPCILHYHGVCFAPPRVNLVFELCELGSLYDVIPVHGKGWDLAQRLLMALCGAEALAYLHEFTPPIIHHDVKSGNFLVKVIEASDSSANASTMSQTLGRPGQLCLRLCDFGESRVFEDSLCDDFGDDQFGAVAGTPAWMAPEIHNCEAKDQSVDVYALGVVMWETFTGNRPFEGTNNLEIARLVGAENKRPAFPPGRVPTAVQRLIEDCWQRSPHRRPTAKQVAERLVALLQSTSGNHERKLAADAAATVAVSVDDL